MPRADEPAYDAILLVSFGGPERREDVLPFLENVVRGKPVPRERLLEVAEHYDHCGGRSPLNDQNRALIAALRSQLDAHGMSLPIYWGNRNWRPFLADAMRQMAADGIRRALGFVTSAYSSYSGCRQYLENIEQARTAAGPEAPRVDKLRAFFNHPGFIAAVADYAGEALAQVPPDRRAAASLVFTAHSIPLAMARNCRYEAQLLEASRLVAESLGRREWTLVYQSRSGPPSQPWLGPDIGERLRELAAAGARDVLVVPIGFVSDHVEIVYDLDTAARQLCGELGLNLVRARTPGTHPRFVAMMRELIEERLHPGIERRALGTFGPLPDDCPADCCPIGN